MMMLDVGCGQRKRDGCIGIDRVPLIGVDVVYDLARFPWPFKESTFKEIFAVHVLEHIPNTIAVMEEIHRVGSPGGVVHITVPYYRYEGAYRDPTHVNFFTENSFYYFVPKAEMKVKVPDHYTHRKFSIVDLQLIRAGRWDHLIERRLKSHAVKRMARRLLHGGVTDIEVDLKVLK